MINVLMLFFLFLTVELYYMYKWDKSCFNNINTITSDYIECVFKPLSTDEYFNKLYNNETVERAFNKKFRNDNIVHNKKRPIIFTGCSFTWGDGLEENETISFKFSKYTNRTVYNRAGCGWGLSQLLYQTRLEKFYEKIIEPEAVIYVYIQDHKNRINKFKIEPNIKCIQPKYINKNNKLTLIKPHFYNLFYSVQNFEYFSNYMFNKVTDEDIILYFNEAKKEITKRWKNTRFIILIYPIKNSQEQDKILTEKLKNSNFEVINISDIVNVDLTKQEYKWLDGWHPAAKTWEIIVPPLVKELHLKN